MSTATNSKTVYYFTYTECQRLPRSHKTNPCGWDLSTRVRRKRGPFKWISTAENAMVDVMGLATTMPGSMELHEEEVECD